MKDYSDKPYKGSLVIAAVGLILAIVSIATPEWTKESGVTIGLWTVTVSDGTSYSWIDKGLYEDFYYSPWFMATRALMMAGLILGGLGVFSNMCVIAKNPKQGGKVLFVYYLAAYCLLICAAAVYSSLIPQGVAEDGGITTVKENIVTYIYTASYGYSLWLCWISSGIFLLASGMAFEGSNQQKHERKFEKLVDS